MFYRQSASGYAAPLPGITQKTLVHGEKTLLTEFKLKQGCVLPHHAHPYEQTGYLVSGHLRLTIGSEEFDVRPGDSWNIPVNVEHCARVEEDSVAVEVFSPPRPDYLPK